MEFREQCHTGLCILYSKLSAAGNELMDIPRISHPYGHNLFWEGIGLRRVASLDGSARDEEPLIINPVNWLGGQVLVPGDFKGARIHTVRGVRNGPIGPIAALMSRYICDS